MKPTVIITMAGEGSRFKALGFKEPKHMLTVRGKTLFEWSMLSLKNFFEFPFIFICREEHQTAEFVQSCAEDLGISKITIKEIVGLTAGQADTALLAKPFLNPSEPAIIFNIDTYVKPQGLRPENIRGDGWVPAFKAEGDRWSFVDFDSNFKVTRVTEKTRISDYGTIGLYYFKSFQLFEDCLAKHSFAGLKERYIAPLYEQLLNDPASEVYTHLIPPEFVHVLGTPEDILQFAPEFADDIKRVK